MQDINKRPIDRAFKVLCDTSVKSYNRRTVVEPGIFYHPYSHLLMTVNNPQAVLNNAEVMYFHSELIKKIGLDVKTLSLYRDDITELLLSLADRKNSGGIDGVIVGDNQGNLMLEEGTIYILSTAEDDSVVKDRRGRNPRGAGRIIMQRTSTLPEVNGFIISGETQQVFHYAEGKRARLFDPSRRKKSKEGVIIEGDGEEKVTPYEKYFEDFEKPS